MKHISLGGLDVSRIGLGTMAMSGYYFDPSSSQAESIGRTRDDPARPRRAPDRRAADRVLAVDT